MSRKEKGAKRQNIVLSFVPGIYFFYILAVHYTTQVILFYFNDEIYMQMSENKEQMDIIILSRFVKMGKR